MAAADSVNRSCPLAALLEREANMEAMGARSTGGGKPDKRARDCWNVSTHRTSGARRTTWRTFQATPSRATNVIRAFRKGFVSNATSSAGNRKAATSDTAARNTTMRTR